MLVQDKKEQWEGLISTGGGVSGTFFLQENTLAISPVRLCVPLPLPSGIPEPHLHTEVCAWNLSLLLCCGNLLGQKAIGSNHDVICRESAWIQNKAKSKQFLLEPDRGRVDFFMKRPSGEIIAQCLGCLPSMFKALGLIPSTLRIKKIDR